MSWTWRSDRGQGHAQTRLRFEPLEERSLLAVAAFHINLYEDVGGAPGELITDDTVEVGDSFFVEITAREYDSDASGLGGVSLDIAWDPAVLQVIDEDVRDTVSSNLPVIRTGTLDNGAGEITDLGGSALLSSGAGRPIGNLVTEQFALLHFQATAPAEDSSITMNQGVSRITTVPVASLSSKDLDFETQTITVLASSQLASEEAPLPAEPLPAAESNTSPKSTPLAESAVAAPADDEGPVLGLQSNLYEDAGGGPGQLIGDGTVEVGESFYVQITAEDLRDTPQGIGGLSVEVTWDPEVFEEIDLPFDPATIVTDELPLYQSGSLDQDAGRIDDLGGVALRSMGQGQPIGTDGAEPFALLHFIAIAGADLAPISLGIGSSGVGVVEGSVDDPSDVMIQSATISVVENVGPPQIAVTSTSGPDLESIQFVTELEGAVSPLVRPALPDRSQFVDVTNTGESPLSIEAVQVNAPDVQVTVPPSGLVLQAGETERLHLTYAPTTPSPKKMTAQSFQVEEGLVILSDAENSPKVEIAMTGHSTFDADITYDGSVNIADLVGFDDHCGTRSGDRDYHPSFDPNGDGSVDLGDFGALNVYYQQARPAVDAPVASQSGSFSRATDLALSGMVQEDTPAVLSSEETDELAAAVAAVLSYGNGDRGNTADNVQGPALPDLMLWE